MTTHQDEAPSWLDAESDEPPETDDDPAERYPTPDDSPAAAPTVAAHRVPPHNLEAEESLLGAMLLSRDAITAAVEQHVEPSDFYKPAHALIYRAITEVHADNHGVDVVTVAAQLGDQLDPIGGRQALREIQASTPASANAARYAEIVTADARQRQLLHLAGNLAEAIYDHDPTDAVLHQLQLVATPKITDRFEPGGAFIAGGAHGVAPIWGNDEGHVLWAEGESLILCGPTGVGKTTLTGQVVLARLGLIDQVLGFPVAPTTSRVLYIAADRPSQIQRSFARMVAPNWTEHIDQHLTVWKGPPDQDFGRHPQAMLSMARSCGADTVIVDSLKDVAIGLRDDDIGAGLNSAIQHCLANGVQVAALHHQRKGQQGTKPKTIEDVYGSTWITAGAGSVVLLWGDPGDAIVQLTHLKQPANPVGPFELDHDHDHGITTISRGVVDVLHLVRHSVGGITSSDLATLNKDGGKPSKNDVRNARRQLDRLVRSGHAHRIEAKTSRTDDPAPVRYVAADRDHTPALDLSEMSQEPLDPEDDYETF